MCTIQLSSVDDASNSSVRKWENYCTTRDTICSCTTILLRIIRSAQMTRNAIERENTPCDMLNYEKGYVSPHLLRGVSHLLATYKRYRSLKCHHIPATVGRANHRYWGKKYTSPGHARQLTSHSNIHTTTRIIEAAPRGIFEANKYNNGIEGTVEDATNGINYTTNNLWQQWRMHVPIPKKLTITQAEGYPVHTQERERARKSYNSNSFLL